MTQQQFHTFHIKPITNVTPEIQANVINVLISMPAIEGGAAGGLFGCGSDGAGHGVYGDGGGASGDGAIGGGTCGEHAQHVG